MSWLDLDFGLPELSELVALPFFPWKSIRKSCKIFWSSFVDIISTPMLTLSFRILPDPKIICLQNDLVGLGLRASSLELWGTFHLLVLSFSLPILFSFCFVFSFNFMPFSFVQPVCEVSHK